MLISIIVVLALILVAGLVIASIYQNGSTSTKSILKAQAKVLANAGQQIGGANAIFVVVISIALVAVLVISSVYYGGNTFAHSRLRGQMATLINAGQQIAGATTLFQNDNGYVPSYDELFATTDYLASPPAVPAFAKGHWVITKTEVFIPLDKNSISIDGFCAYVGSQNGSDIAYAAEYGSSLPYHVRYGCVGDRDETTFNYKR